MNNEFYELHLKIQEAEEVLRDLSIALVDIAPEFEEAALLQEQVDRLRAVWETGLSPELKARIKAEVLNAEAYNQAEDLYADSQYL